MNEMSRIVAAPVESRRARITTAQFLRICDAGVFDDDDGKLELVEGELERMPPPQNAHSLLQGAVYSQLVALFGALRTRVEIGVEVGADTVFGCDVVVLLEPVVADRWPTAEEVLLAVEVSRSTLGRDLGMKVPRYAAAGVPHCWIVDRRTSVIYVHAGPDNGQYSDVSTIRFGEPLAVPGTDATITLS